jgi:Fe-S-cluster containining protein
MWNGPVFDCQTCGACCTDREPSDGGYVYLSRPESRRLRQLGLTVVQAGGDSFLGTRPGQAGCVCSAFVGQVGGRCSCSIYQSRPQRCREFEAGGPLCRAARLDAGLPV